MASPSNQSFRLMQWFTSLQTAHPSAVACLQYGPSQLCVLVMPVMYAKRQLVSTGHVPHCRHPAGHSTVIIPAAGDDALGWTTLKDSIQRVCGIAQVPPLDEDEVCAMCKALHVQAACAVVEC